MKLRSWTQTFLLLLVVSSLVAGGCVCPDRAVVGGFAEGLRATDPYTLVGERNFITDFLPLDEHGNLRVVVEIPAGTTAKWEVDKREGALKWEFKSGKPRVVAYLGYPGNYGMVPRTLLPETEGGDGDPLDVLVLGPAVPRGSVVSVRIIGVLRLLDGGEKDDKIIAVLPDSALGRVTDIDELNVQYPGITRIIETWFTQYKGPGKLEAKGFGDAEEARRLVTAAVSAFPRG